MYTLINQIQQALIGSGYLDTDSRLRALFIDPRLSSFKAGLPQGNNLMDRASSVTAYLYEQQHAVTGENVLVSLLRVIQEQIHPHDSRHGTLGRLADDLQRSLSGGASPSMSGTVNLPGATISHNQGMKIVGFEYGPGNQPPQPNGDWEAEAEEILAGWSLEEIVLFCYDTLPTVYQKLSQRPHNVKRLIKVMLRHCRKTGQGETLLDGLEAYEL